MLKLLLMAQPAQAKKTRRLLAYQCKSCIALISKVGNIRIARGELRGWISARRSAMTSTRRIRAFAREKIIAS